MDSFKVIAEYFDLPYVPGAPENQDWELLVADSSRITEFIDSFDTFEDSPQIVLAQLILASFEEAAEENAFSLVEWNRFWSYLREDIEKFTFTITSWIDFNDPSPRTIDIQLRKSLANDGFLILPDNSITRNP